MPQQRTSVVRPTMGILHHRIHPHADEQTLLQRMHEMQTIVTDDRSVCQSVCHTARLCIVHSCSLCQIIGFLYVTPPLRKQQTWKQEVVSFYRSLHVANLFCHLWVIIHTISKIEVTFHYQKASIKNVNTYNNCSLFEVTNMWTLAIYFYHRRHGHTIVANHATTTNLSWQQILT